MFVPASRRPALALRLALLLALGVAGSAGCYRGPRQGGAGAPAAGQPQRGRGARPALLDPTTAYAQAGLLAESSPIPFVGNVRYVAGGTTDSTLILVTLSLANRALTFSGEGEGQQARYQVSLELRQGASIVRHTDAREVVRVASFRETSRSDESVIFQQWLSVAPGQYVLSVAVRDEGSARNGQHEMLLAVPRMAASRLSSPITVYEATPRTSDDTIPRLVANPRATVIFGRDSLARLYLEGYDFPQPPRVALTAYTEANAVIWRDTATLAHGAPPGAGEDRVRAGVITLPVARLGVGRLSVLIAPVDAPADTVRTPLFVSFGEEWAIGSFDEMLSYLRYYASPQRLQALRDAAGEARAAAWGTFFQETDPDPRTPEHEGLRDYFNRLQVANERFREEGQPGWLSDRGKVYVTLGEPDQVLEQGDNTLAQRGRAQIWTYSQHRLQLIFIDQSGFGRWRLTSGSEADFSAVAMRERR